MSILRKSIRLSAAAALLVLLTFLHKLNTDDPSQARFRVSRHDEFFLDTSISSSVGRNYSYHRVHKPLEAAARALSTNFRHGVPKPSGSTYSRLMVVPRLEDDDVSWITKELPGVDAAIYVANDPKAPLHPPRNRGHEVMIYLTYIIDHYDELPDIIIFMHAHRWTHHNIELLGHDSAEMVRRLNNDYVIHEGYVNMRCQWYPGCPDWLHPHDARETLVKQEQVVLTKSWQELFPSEPLPEALGQACCAQFALSKERVLSIPLSRFVFYRDWISRTPLSDYVSGRIWEYLWQLLFTGNSIHCPSEEICHCQGFGICFGGNAGYNEYKELRQRKATYEVELEDLDKRQSRGASRGAEYGRRHNASSMKVINHNRQRYFSDRLEALEKEIRARQTEAIEGAGGSGERYSELGRKREDF